jgi:hypothetical protein
MKKLFVFGVAAAAILSAPTPTIASDHDRVGEQGGGIDIGPWGQCFDVRACGRGYYRGYYGYAFAPSYRYYRHPRYYRY